MTIVDRYNLFGKNSLTASFFENLCFQWNYGLAIVENIEEVFLVTYSNATILFEYHKAFRENRKSTSINDDYIEKVKETVL